VNNEEAEGAQGCAPNLYPIAGKKLESYSTSQRDNPKIAAVFRIFLKY
jgi:hypothetical protein